MMSSLHTGRCVVLTAAVALALGTMSPAHAQDEAASIKALKAMVRKQAGEIAQLQQRVAELEAARTTATAPVLAPAPPAATADLRQMQVEVAQLKAEQAGRPAKAAKQAKVPPFGLASADGRNTLQAIGRINWDVSDTRGSNYDARSIEGSEFRRLRLGAQGKLDGYMDYKVEMDFAGSKVGVRSAWLGVAPKLGDNDVAIHVGNNFNDRGLAGSTGSNNIWFMERNAVANAIAPDFGYYGMGVQSAIQGAGKDWHASLGVYDGSASQAAGVPRSLTYEARAHWNPYLSGSAMLHLGAWGFFENFNRSGLVLPQSVGLSTHFANSPLAIIGTTITTPQSSTGYGVELAGAVGSFAAAAEYGWLATTARAGIGGASQRSHAWSGSLSWFVTGETTPYHSRNGTWGYPKILHPLGAGGPGAFQLVARFEKIDFDDAPLFVGGNGHAATLGLNWYLSGNSRLMFDWIHWYTDNVTGLYPGPDSGNTFGARAQVVW